MKNNYYNAKRKIQLVIVVAFCLLFSNLSRADISQPIGNLYNQYFEVQNINVANDLQLGGYTITMLKGAERGQQLSLVIQGPDGSLVVVDGGYKTSAQRLSEYIRDHGNKVDAWLITHAHEDHAGALSVILREKQMGVNSIMSCLDIRNIYYSFAPLDFYKIFEPKVRYTFEKEIIDALGSFDSAKLHADTPSGTHIKAGSIDIEVLNKAYLSDVNSGNNSSVCYRITLGNKKLLILGDLPYEASEKLLLDVGEAAVKADIVQMAHHGQHGASLRFYKAVSPEACLWPSNKELWDSRNDEFSPDQQTITVALTKYWMDQLGVQRHYAMADGDWILQ